MGPIEWTLTGIACVGIVAILLAMRRETVRRRKLAAERYRGHVPPRPMPAPAVNRVAMPPARPAPPPVVREFGSSD